MKWFLIFLLSGCTSFDYEWVQTRPVSVKPWFYVEVDNVDSVCRFIGADYMHQLERINACSQWQVKGCIVYLPKNYPSWIKAHEEKHCMGFIHGA